jgi:glycosyltransferase involved in cell wall biosynthesis
MKLLIAIPALNEEQSIAAIIERCLAARSVIVGESPVTEVEVTVVSDGSTDRTVERARRYAGEVSVIVFTENRGYGAAIQEAWRQSDAELLGFLDADGTCDPRFFAPLCREVLEHGADVVLGNRMTRDSQMPAFRRLGNRVFGALLSVFSSRIVHDTASGMRVVRRSALAKLLPLPAGMHFTPAMSARALLRQDVAIRELPMPYAEREGLSKLRPWRDGLRFLRTIVEATLLFRPSRPLSLAGAALFVSASVLMTPPLLHYLAERTVEEWMIYRFVVSQLLGSTAVLCWCVAYLARRLMVAAGVREARPHRGEEVARRFFGGIWFWLAEALLLLAGLVLVEPSLRSLVTTGATYEHWSRFVVASFLGGTAAILAVTWILHRAAELFEAQLEFVRRASP